MTSEAPSRVTFEHLGPDALGIGVSQPRVSWTYAHSLQVRLSGHDLEVTFDDARVIEHREGSQTVLQSWVRRSLQSRERAVVRVRSTFSDGTTSPWSEGSAVEAGLLGNGEWDGQFIGPSRDSSRAPIVYRRIPVNGKVARARVYATAHGIYSLEINGQRLQDAVLEPGWQSYEHRLRYRTYDITNRMHGNTLLVAVWLADGWYRGRLGFPLIQQSNVYGSALGALVQVEIEYEDGRRQQISSDATWLWQEGPVLSAGLYDGESFDAGLAITLDEASGSAVSVLDAPLAPLVAPLGPPVRPVETIRPEQIWTSPGGNTLVDFGQNLVGWLRIRPVGAAGDTVTLRHAEVLDAGELSLRPLRTAEAKDQYMLKGGGREEWEPRFTFHGFRYAQVEGWPGELKADDLDAVVAHTDMRRIGWLTTSNPLLNRLHENVVWGMRGNFVDIPTDCPQRDERLGWTGDIAVFAPTAVFLYDCVGMLSSWLQDLAAEQRADGFVPFFVPQLHFPDSVRHIAGLDPQHAAVWGDAAVLVPMALFDATGDIAILHAQYDSMVRWVDSVHARTDTDHIWSNGFQFGDWLDPTAPPDDPAAGATDPTLVATAFHAYSARLVARAAEILNRPVDAERYSELADHVTLSFRGRFSDPLTGALTVDTQSAHAIALCLNLVAEEHRVAVGERLVQLVRNADYTLTTGFVGTPLLLHALSNVGAFDTAYRVLLQETCPSWLYIISMGATTMWERWDSMLPDGTINSGEMTSFNHYALGAVADWMHKVIGGLAPLEPGYRRFSVAPRPGGALTSAAVSHICPYGQIDVRWRVEAQGLTVDISVPPGTSAVLDIGGIEHRELPPGEHTVRETSFTATTPHFGGDSG